MNSPLNSRIGAVDDVLPDLPADTPAWDAEHPSQVRNEAGASLRGDANANGAKMGLDLQPRF